MNTKIKILIILQFLNITASKQNNKFNKVLLVIDDESYYATHSIFLNDLKKKCKLFKIINVIEDSFKIQEFKEFKYDIIIFLGLKTDKFSKIEELWNYFEAGNNILYIMNQYSPSLQNDLIKTFGLTVLNNNNLLLSPDSSVNNYDPSVIKIGKENIPFEFLNNVDYIVYRGGVIEPNPFENYQIFNFVNIPQYSSKLNYNNKEEALYSSIKYDSSLVAGMQGLNNARFALIPNDEILNNKFITISKLNNLKFSHNLLAWLSSKLGNIKFSNFRIMRLDNSEHTTFIAGEDLYFTFELLVYNHNTNHYEPLNNIRNIQFELNKVECFYRDYVDIIDYTKGVYGKKFRTLTTTGVYNLNIEIKLPGFNFLKISKDIVFKDFKHIESELHQFHSLPIIIIMLVISVSCLIQIINILYNKNNK